MKQFIQSFLPRRSLWRITAVWLVGAFLLALGLSACGGQTKDTPPTRAAPAVIPAGADDETNVQAAPVAGQTTTGFNIDGWF